jgi:hypothetical protein
MIGKSIWHFDINRRVYPKRTGLGSAPIYAQHFVEYKIVGETPQSWLVDSYAKQIPVSKKALAAGDNPKGFFTEEQMQDRIWLHDNHYAIIERVRQCNDSATLRAIAEVLNGPRH